MVEYQYGIIECCSCCHNWKRIQYILKTRVNNLGFCSQKCLRHFVNHTIFSENEDWINFIWIVEEKEE